MVWTLCTVFTIKKTNLDSPRLLKMYKDDAGLDWERLSERIVHMYWHNVIWKIEDDLLDAQTPIYITLTICRFLGRLGKYCKLDYCVESLKCYD